ncbi:SIS domain-containing protein [Methylovirgula sp. 4M-Z18]|uniref:SIS domain-containing protein n=1 Tax=Methylovirgula sp. 4M-Z18 TaxID=2293567 RepID=UPI000E2FC401|nr:SIS domain-containing protein [Methylovirgula sp. 4M-Z18]RFB79876.1 SIS domain-containing protein [Methylovirgula sp. 4M-Z18]
MRREVLEIPQAVARLFDRSSVEIERAGSTLRTIDPNVIVTVARGSSDHAASFLKYAIELTIGVPVASLGPSIASIYEVRLKLANAACIAISQSGKSPDIVAMTHTACRGGATGIALTNTAGSPLTKAVGHPIDIAAGAEKSVAATKTFVNSAVAGLGILAHWAGDKALLTAARELPQHLERAVACDWNIFGDALDRAPSVFVLGRGPTLAIANEVALKFKETCSLHAEAYSGAEVMHGPMALVGPGFPVLALAARDRAEVSIVDAADVLAGKGAATFVTSDRASKAAHLPFAATGHPLTDALVLIASFYAFVEAFARRRGLNPDEPRNLRKVTETI